MPSPANLTIALAQINSRLGDFAGNSQKILDYCERAFANESDLVVFPELSLFGYQPLDLLEQEDFVTRQTSALKELAKKIPKNIHVLIGAITKNPRKTGKPYLNSAVLLRRGSKPLLFHKQLLPTYDIFDEARFFAPGRTKDNIFKIRGQEVLVTICEDIWAWDIPGRKSRHELNPLLECRKLRPDLVLNLSASPFTLNKQKDRLRVVQKTAQHFKAPVVYVNLVGAQDEVVFDGGSLVVNAKGQCLAQACHFEEALLTVDLPAARPLAKKLKASRPTEGAEPIEGLRRALVLGIRDFFEKNGFRQIHLGLSGGVDSALAACLAVDAVGPSRVKGFALPGPFSSPQSEQLAQELAKNLGVEISTLAITDLYKNALALLERSLGQFDFGVTNENLQARLRGLLLMAYANHSHSLLLSTGNKSELATGYSTLYGDMCGGLAPLGDLLKNQVYALCEVYNSQKLIIPKQILTRAPSAELRPDQVDQDTLPPYDALDAAVQRQLIEHRSPTSKTDKWLAARLNSTEFKRWQAPPILKVTEHAFGRGRRLPITFLK